MKFSRVEMYVIFRNSQWKAKLDAQNIHYYEILNEDKSRS